MTRHGYVALVRLDGDDDDDDDGNMSPPLPATSAYTSAYTSAGTSTSSPSPPLVRPVAKRVATPLGLFLDDSKPKGLGMNFVDAMSPAETPDPTSGDHVVSRSKPYEHQPLPQTRQQNPPRATPTDSSFTLLRSPRSPRSPFALAPTGYNPDEAPATPSAWNPVNIMTESLPPPDHDSHLDLTDGRPLRTANVRADTRFAHPKPVTHPHAMIHTIPDQMIRSGSAADNIAQLEATAERLSVTSSIDDAIRDLHGELKRSDSRRSANLALAAAAAAASTASSVADANITSHAGYSSRVLSPAASIVSINTAARYGGYSPAAFVMSPNTSLSSRLRSGSANSAGRPDATFDNAPSIRSSKLSLSEVSESDPVSLNQQAFDDADAAAAFSPSPSPPDEGNPDNLENQDAENLQSQSSGQDVALAAAYVPDAGASYEKLDHQAVPLTSPQSAPPPVFIDLPTPQEEQEGFEDIQRPESAQSNNTSEQARDAFIDFDGVHWEPEDEEDLYVPAELEQDLPTPRPVPTSTARPTSFIDPSSGHKMLYYPARVPAMLNLPPKLSTKPKTALRNQRRSQVLSAMQDGRNMTPSPSKKTHSAFTDFGLSPSAPAEAEAEAEAEAAPVRESWLPDPLANHRDSFVALSSLDLLDAPEPSQSQQSDVSLRSEETRQGLVPRTLRRPERLSKEAKDNRKSRASMLSNLPPQLRASVFFDLPSISPEVEIKDGSATATLDSILDASANAPVSAFTDHTFAGRLGSEVYGKQKKRQSKSPATLQPATPEPKPKKRSSMMWLSKRSSNYEALSQKRPHSSMGIPSNGADEESDGRLSSESVNSGDRMMMMMMEDEELNEGLEGQEEDIPDDDYQGPPTTLLAELQLRKQEQKDRVKNTSKGFPNGNYATLLEMDTIAEAQRKNRQAKRVNLAWEDSDAHVDQNGSDDEDVPLAIVAAMQRGAKNRADLERPLGLMERREIEDNEPLSHRRARLRKTGSAAAGPDFVHRLSMMSLSVPRTLQVPSQKSKSDVTTPSPEPRTPEVEVEVEVEEIEEESLENRRRRLANKEGELPKTRPVSAAFSAELLSQFGDAASSLTKDESIKSKKSKKEGEQRGATPDPSGEEETLGQRRRRLRTEREARDREISYGASAGASPTPDRQQRRLSMANVLSAHPKREADSRAHEERSRHEAERLAARDRERKMAALRSQMPTSLPQIGVQRSGGYLDGALNDGSGGQAYMAALSSPGRPSYGLAAAGSRSSLMLGSGMAPNYGVPRGHYLPAYGAMAGIRVPSPAGSHFNMPPLSPYQPRPASAVVVSNGGGMMPGQMTNDRPMDRVQQWRYSIRP